jgi:hypothetical protein
LTGATPNSTYTVTECGSYGSSSDCYQLSWILLTDASGNGKATGAGEGGRMIGSLDFEIARKGVDPIQFLTGFNVPQASKAPRASEGLLFPSPRQGK